MKEKIVLIGAGSAMFTRGLIADIVKRRMDCEIRLIDIDADALRVAEKFSLKMIAAAKCDITIKASTDRRDMLKGATSIICTIGVGGRRAWEKDVFIPRKYGIFQPVGDTIMVGGASRALRMIPAMVEISKDVLDVAPEALFFNYANPMSAICRGVRKATGANIIGLCHGVPHVARHLSEILDVEPSNLSYTAAGINHLTWFMSLNDLGKDLTGKLKSTAAKNISKLKDRRDIVTHFKEDGSGKNSSSESDIQDPFTWILTDMYGAFPAVLDRHVTEFFPHLFCSEKGYFGKTLGVDAFSFEDTISHGDRIYDEMSELAHSKSPLPDNYLESFEGEHEQVVEIISNIRLNREKTYSVSMPNRGQVFNLPYDAVIESPAVTTTNGLRPLILSPMPHSLAGVLSLKFHWIEAVVEAALEGNREKFVQALYMDGYSIDAAKIKDMADELLEVQKAYLPKFKKSLYIQHSISNFN